MFDKLKERFGFKRERVVSARSTRESEPTLTIDSRQRTMSGRTSNLVGAVQGPRTTYLASGYRNVHDNTAITHDPNAGTGFMGAMGSVVALGGATALYWFLHGAIATTGVFATIGTGGAFAVVTAVGLLMARYGFGGLS